MKMTEKQDDPMLVSGEEHEQPDAPPNLSGYLLKQSLAGKWQRRYFEINGIYLTYYKTEKLGKLLAALSLPQVGEIKLLEEVEDDKGRGFTFSMDLKDRQYILRSSTLIEAERWIETLCAIRDGKKSSDTTFNATEIQNSRIQSMGMTVSPQKKSGFTKLEQPTGEFEKPQKGCCVLS